MNQVWLAAVVAAAILALAACRREPPAVDDIARMRQDMVDFVARYPAEHRVDDSRVLDALRKVPRHEFVPERLRHLAYEDTPLDIGEGQTISQPYMVGFMSQAAEAKPGDKVLEVGTGSGYQAAILAELGAQVYTVEIVEPLARRARETLQRLGYAGVQVRAGDGYKGWPEQAPFDAVIVTCAPERIPQPLVDQLQEGGRLVIPLGPESSRQELLVARKSGQGLRETARMPVRFVPMTGTAQKPEL
ncbi:MAG: protein-L-isoaspartate(D-aspartate) O-methyltransferase [Elusimicrobia bacterium]|nr:protein-L-isoaspartate(D-aspartate) O-methyltransferase [Elusimicrobiota bacterium]